MGGENNDAVNAEDKGVNGSRAGDAAETVNKNANSTSIDDMEDLTDVILDLTRQQTADGAGASADQEEEGPVKADKDGTGVGKYPPPPPRDEKSSKYDSVKAGKSSRVKSRPRDGKSSSYLKPNDADNNTELSSDFILSLTEQQTIVLGDVEESTKDDGIDDSDVRRNQSEVTTSGVVLPPNPLRRNDRIVQESAPGAVRVAGIDGEEQTTTADDAVISPSPPAEESAPVEPLVSATVVDDDDVLDDDELRENIRQDVLREVAHTEGEVVDVQKEEQHRRRQIWIGMASCVLVAIALGAGLGVGLNNGQNNSSSGFLSTDAPTESPSMAPTTSQCHMCYDSNNSDAALISAEIQSTTNWRSTIIEQTPLRTCQNVFDETLDLSLWDEGCTKLQADASWKCGCPRFPPVPESVNDGNNDTDSSGSTLSCTLCPEGFEAVPLSLLDPVSTCVRASTWLDIVGQNVTRDECDTLYRLAINGCQCVKDEEDGDDNDNDAPVEMTTGQCISVLDQIIAYENGQVEDEMIERTYILCPNTSFKVGIADLAGFETGNAIVDGQFPIVARSNMKVLCGMDGSSNNNCTIRDGSFGVFQSNGWGIPGSITQDSIHIQGVTFVNVTNPIGIYSIANVTLEDCIFDRFGGSAVLVLPWVLPPAPFRRQNRNLRHMDDIPRALQLPVDSEVEHGIVRIFRSIFRNGRIVSTEPSSAVWFRTPGSSAPGPVAMSLLVDDCLFDARGNDEWYNDAIYHRSEGYVHVANTCFWGGRYNQPVFLGEEELNHVVNGEPDYFFEGNYYLRDPSLLFDTTEHCAMNRRGSPGVCGAYFSGDINVCTQRWWNVLEDDSTVQVSVPETEESTALTCGTNELAQKDYRGTLNVTASGKSCQAWDVQFPHTHSRTATNYPTAGLESNFCRNPDNEDAAWCYTTDPEVRFELCDVPSC